MGVMLDLSVAHSALFTQQFPSQTQKQHLITGSSSCLSLTAAHMGIFPFWGLQNLLKAVFLPLYRDTIIAGCLDNMSKKTRVTSSGMEQNLRSPWGPLSLNFASKPSQRRNATPPGSEGEASNQPRGPCWSRVRSMDLSDHPWKICKSKLLTTGRTEADLNVKSCKVSWSPGKWGAKLWSDPLEWCDQRGLHCAAPQEQPAGRK